MVRPSHRREMAQTLVQENQMGIRLASRAFGISEACYRYQSKLSDENVLIAKWLVDLTYAQKNLRFGLCYLFVRNVKGW